MSESHDQRDDATPPPDSPSINYTESRRRLIEAPHPLDTGSWPISWQRISKGWGRLPRAFWPNIEDPKLDPLPNEPPNADAIAKTDRLSSYRRIYTEEDALHALFRNTAINVAVEVGADWHSPIEGRIPLVPTDTPSATHTVCVIEYDFDRSEFVFINSWGKVWGDKGFGYLPNGYLKKYMVDAWELMDHGLTIPRYPALHISWDSKEIVGIGHHITLNLLDGMSDTLMGWATAIKMPHSMRVEDVFVRPEYRGRGYGRNLAGEFFRTRLPREHVRFYVPWGDHEEHNREALLGWARSLGLRLQTTEARVAAYVASIGDPVTSLPELYKIPKRATCSLDMLVGRNRTIHAFDSPPAEWPENQAKRRHELIQKKYESRLSEEEARELTSLQIEFSRFQDAVFPLPQSETS